ncbi:MAG: hypothetical protein K1X29_03965 [Bdellovibrionales bacterium]|nr:hypothetical protein [Bdellovibrionales bacterium]
MKKNVCYLKKNRYLHTNLNSTKGYSLIELLLSSMLLSSLVLGLATVSTTLVDTEGTLRTRSSVLQSKSEIVANLSNSAVWQKNLELAGTLIDPDNKKSSKINPELTCIRNNTVCPRGEHKLTLYSANGKILVDSGKENIGYTKDGSSCDTFSATSTNIESSSKSQRSGTSTLNTLTPSNCLYRLSLSWEPICPTVGSCMKPQVLVKINTYTSSQFQKVTSNMSGSQSLQMKMLIKEPRETPLLPKGILVYTNSSVYYPNESTRDIDLSAAITDGSKRNLSVVLAKNTTKFDGTVTPVTGTIVKYTPKDGYYGVDYFNYTFINNNNNSKATGTVYIRVMTPYSWTGLAGGNDISTKNKLNFCGKVISGKCDSTTFPSSIYYSALADAHYVFDNTCSVCNVNIDGTPGYGYASLKGTSVELNNFSGTINQLSDVELSFFQNPSKWLKPISFWMKSGIWKGGNGKIWVDRVTYYGGWKPANLEDIAVKIDNGKMVSPKDFIINGALHISGPGVFDHNNGTVTLNKYWSRNNNSYTPNVTFFNLNFGNPTQAEGEAVSSSIASNITVQNNMGIYPRGFDAGLSSGYDPVTGQSKTVASVWSLKGDLYVGGKGGAGFLGIPPIIEFNGDKDQTIHGMNVDNSTDTQALSDGVLFSLNNRFEIPYAPSVRINKSQGKMNITDVFATAGDFENISAESYNFYPSTLVFAAAWRGGTFTPGTAEYNNLIWAHSFGYLKINANELTIKGNFEHRGNYYVYGNPSKGTRINLYGDLVLEGDNDHDHLSEAIVVSLVGGSNQKIRKIGLPGTIATHLEVNKTGGTVTMSGQIATNCDVIVNSGSVVTSTGFTLSSSGVNSFISNIKFPLTTRIDNLQVNHSMKLLSDVSVNNLIIGPGTNPMYSGGLVGNGKKIVVHKDTTLNKNLSTGLSTNPIQIDLAGVDDQKIIFTSAATGLGFGNFNINASNNVGKVTTEGTGKLGEFKVSNGTAISCSSILTVNQLITNFGTILKKDGGTGSLIAASSQIQGTTPLCP